MQLASSRRLFSAAAALTLLGACAEDTPQSPGDGPRSAGTDQAVMIGAYDAGDQAHRRACGAAEYRQFDFWLGKWEVTENGAPAGTNIIRKALDGCAVLESYAVAGFVGRSLNSYDAATRRWHQHWVDHVGTVLSLFGGIQDGSMVLEGVRPLPSGNHTVDRVTWSELGQGEVKQFWVFSSDFGQTFPNVQFDGLYRRVASLTPDPEVPQEACKDPNFPVLDELDYTLGEWEVDVAGPHGPEGLRSRITKELSDCLIEERIDGENGYEAIAFTSVRRRLGIWERTFVDNRGTNAFLSGRTTDGRLMLTGTAPSKQGGALDVRVSFTRKSDDRFEQRWERTSDGGATWHRLLVVTYRRK
jgi:hypothetical protein